MTWREHRTILQASLAKSRVGIITDMDGTLSHIVNDPDAAQITPKNLDLLNQLSQKLSLVAVVSGRAVNDVVEKINLPNVVYIGNHGMEHWQNGQAVVTPEIADTRPRIESAINELKLQLPEGMWIEDKQVTLSIHYRNTDNPSQIATSFKPIVTHIATKNNLSAFDGHMIFEIRPQVEINKGTAFRHLVQEHHLDTAFFIGDDVTDVDAFIMAKQLRETKNYDAYAVGVESDDTPPSVSDNADMMVSGVSDVEVFLSWVLEASKASET